MLSPLLSASLLRPQCSQVPTLRRALGILCFTQALEPGSRL